MSVAREYLSIGEVLGALKADFPDVSVSKIRFLESEGLIAPERTPSGYRKFYPADVSRLRAILRLQRDSFLPLKVIRERLAAVDAGQIDIEALGDPPAVTAVPEQPTVPHASPTPTTDAAPAAPAADADELLDAVPEPSLTEHDLARATGLTVPQVQQLREFGVICEHARNGASYFDADDVHVGTLAKEFFALGIEPRHLKQLRRFAEQEAALFEQLVVPAMRTRRPEARDRAAGTLTQLASLSRALRQAYVRQSLRATLNGDR